MSKSGDFAIAELAAILSLETDEHGGQLVFSRHGYSLAAPASIAALLDPHTARGRHLAYGVLFGIRLAIDRNATDFDVSDERPEKPARVFHHHELPSVYGERLPRLVPRPTLRWFEALTGLQPVTSAWNTDGLSFVYILETGRHLHTVVESDMPRMDITRERLLSDARHALFYDSYKLKPRHEERIDAGRVRTFRTVEGVGASRAMLLPDFDYDAARERGCFSIPSRDTLVIGRPADESFSDAIFARVGEVTAKLVDSEPFPLCAKVYPMTADVVDKGESVGEYSLWKGDQDAEALAPPPGTRLRRT